MLDDAGRVLGEQEFEHGGAGLSEMANWLLSFAAGEAVEVGVAIETPRGPVVERLMERGFALHSINPKQLDRFRDRLSPAGAKDDRRDARTLAAALRTDPHCLRRLEPTDPVIVELREWSRLSEELTRERVRLANRMREQLWRYYPQFLDTVDDDVASLLALHLWRNLPTRRAGQRVREATLAKVLKQHRIRRIAAATLRDRLRAPAVKVAPGAAEAAAAHVRLVVERLVMVNRQLDDARHHLDRLVRQLAEPASATTRTYPRRPSQGCRKRSPTRPFCFRCPASAPACSPRYLPKVATRCGGGTTTRCAVSAEWLRSLGVQARACSSRAVWPPTIDYASPPTTGPVLPPNATRSATPSIRCSATAPPSTGTAPAPPLCEKRDAATTGHPVPLCSNPKRVEEDTKTPLAKWWGVLFLDQRPRLVGPFYVIEITQERDDIIARAK